MAAGWFFSRNYAALADEPRSRRALGIGFAATVLVAAVAFGLPPKFPHALLPAAYTAAIDLYASRCFGTIYQEHVANGGARGSWWTVVGIALLSCVLLIAVAVIGVYAIAWWKGAQIDWDPRH